MVIATAANGKMMKRVINMSLQNYRRETGRHGDNYEVTKNQQKIRRESFTDFTKSVLTALSFYVQSTDA